jgi:hypothetical protein
MQALVLGQIAVYVLIAERKRHSRFPPLALLLRFAKHPVAVSPAVESPDVLETLLAVLISAEIDPRFVLLPSHRRGHCSIPRWMTSNPLTPIRSQRFGIRRAIPTPPEQCLASRRAAPVHHTSITLLLHRPFGPLGNLRGYAD